MKGLKVQIQSARVPGVDVTATIARLRAVAEAVVDYGDDNGPFVNVRYETADLPAVWAGVKEVLRTDAALARSGIVCCQGDHGWDDYLLLHHFDPAEPLDELR